MGGEHHDSTTLARFQKRSQNPLGVGIVEIPSGFVGKHDVGFLDQSPSESNPLRFPA